MLALSIFLKGLCTGACLTLLRINFTANWGSRP